MWDGMDAVAPFEWPLVDAFLDRTSELDLLERWWASGERTPINLFGRRRVGKSWLFRRFAHGKPAVVLVAHQLSEGAQLSGFAERLEAVLGFRPDLPDVATLLRVLYRAGRAGKLLAVIDEFGWLLPGTEVADRRVLSQIQAVMEEERDASELKLVLCGSTVGQMEALQGERSPLHGRLRPVPLRPVPFAAATAFLPGLRPTEAFVRYAIAGGMPRYLDAVSGPDLKAALCRNVLDRNAPLWDEGRVILDQELREPRVYFALLAQLATGDKELAEIGERARVPSGQVSKYLSVLDDLGIVRRRLPVGAKPESRRGHWRLDDPFLRFWFRFVHPFQDDLETGLRPDDLFEAEISGRLADHVAPAFETWCREWVRATHGASATKVGAWWGPSLHSLRRDRIRSTEEIDIVGIRQGRVTVIGEAKWQQRALDTSILADLDTYKIPALAQAGWKLVADLKIVLLAKGGYTAGLRRAAEQRGGIELIDVSAALAGDT